MGNVWKNIEFDEEVAESLAEQLELPLPLGKILAARGFSEKESAEKFLDAKLSDLDDPFIIPDMQKAVDRVKKALEKNEIITVFGDFDTDGVTATAVLVKVLRQLGADVAGSLPDRLLEGYGFSLAAFKRCMAERKADLIITTDCGITAYDAVDEAKKIGVDIVVTDHHDINSPVAAALAVVNPKRGDDPNSRLLAGVGVAFKLCHAIIKDFKSRDEDVASIDLKDVLDLVAVGTVADVVPLLGDNRILVKHGLKKINSNPCAGLSALIKISKIDSIMNCYHIGFMLAPRLNASGRLGNADKALDLVLSTDPKEAFELARELDGINKERRVIENEILEAAIEDVDRRFDAGHTCAIVVGQEGWHVGVIGIVASRISGRYHRPSIVIGFNKDGVGRGSCRSIVGINIVEILAECKDLLEAYGGHEMAAGITIKQKNLIAFRRRFNEACSERVEVKDMRPVIQVDAWIDLKDANEKLLSGINRLAPVGSGNPTPIWGVRNVRPVGVPRIVGKNHIKMVVGCGDIELESIGFGLGDVELPSGAMDMLAQLKENTFGGRRSLQLNIKDFRSSENI
jgi:single-stranded-DNA-specific exonuclease